MRSRFFVPGGRLFSFLFLMLLFFPKKSETMETRGGKIGINIQKRDSYGCFTFRFTFCFTFFLFHFLKRRKTEIGCFRCCFCFTFQREKSETRKVKQAITIDIQCVTQQISVVSLSPLFSVQNKTRKNIK
jgi:hypothetical protein